MKNVIVRSLSGVVYIAVIVFAVLTQSFWIYALCAFFAAVGAEEYVNIADKATGNNTSKAIKIVDIIFILLPVLLVIPIVFLPDVEASAKDDFIAIIVLTLIFIRMIISVFDKSTTAISTLSSTVLGIFYIAVPLICVCMCTLTQAIFTLATFVLIWLNDTGAFCVGCTLGRHKLCERLSPKKSIEGFIGGLAVCVIASAIFAIVKGYDVVFWMIYGAVVSILSTIGDLFESMLKRRAGVKDAGNLIPGHGGVLDRIDSLLFVSPVALIFLLILLSQHPELRYFF